MIKWHDVNQSIVIVGYNRQTINNAAIDSFITVSYVNRYNTLCLGDTSKQTGVYTNNRV